VFKQNKSSSGFKFLDRTRRSNSDILYELGNQYQYLFDLHNETAGFNRLKDETIQEYMARLVVNDKIGSSQDYSIPEFPPEQMEKFNNKIKTFDSTYYFAYSTGDRNMSRTKMREVMHEPARTSEMMLGFDGDMLKNLKLRGTVDKVRG